MSNQTPPVRRQLIIEWAKNLELVARVQEKLLDDYLLREAIAEELG